MSIRSRAQTIAGAALLLVGALASAQSSAPCDADSIRSHSLASREGLGGRYGSGLAALAVAPCGDGFAVQPVISGNPALLMRVGVDRFAFLERPERQIVFRRSRDGTVEAVARAGTEQWLERAKPGAQVQDDLLLGRPDQAAARVGQPGEPELAEALELASAIGVKLPSRRAAVARFFDALAPRAPDSVAFHLAHGDALAQVGHMGSARRAYAKAVAAGASTEQLLARLRMTGAAPASPGGWTLPFALSQLLAAPRQDEMAAVLADWQSRTQDVSEVQEVHRQQLQIGGQQREAIVLSYRFNGGRQYGVVVLPEAHGPRCCAVLVDIKGTTPDYAPLDLDRQLPRSFRELGTLQSRTLVALPALRGERLTLGGKTFTSDGDRRDGWDGATDDARALLTVVLARFPQADPRRVCAFGHSRGASLAMMAAIRDRRFGCVVAEAGPVDWFALMPEDGWPLPAVVTEGLFSQSPPGRLGGQFIERFLAPVIAGQWTLAEARHRLLASSPLYFADRLPSTLAVYGGDDASVAMENGVALRSKLAGVPSSRVVIQPSLGHDLDPVDTPRLAGMFLRAHLGSTMRHER